MIGTRLGNYRIVQQLGAGGMGAVYLAEHQLLGRRAAVKVLLPIPNPLYLEPAMRQIPFAPHF